MKVLIIRHAQSSNNKAFELGLPDAHRAPDPLITELGERQAQALADWSMWQTLRPGRLFCSLMSRTIQTALPLADRLDLPLEARADLFECAGPYVGTYADQQHHPGTPSSRLAALGQRVVLPDTATEDGWWHGPVEAATDSMRRAIALVEWLGTLEEECVALVCHGAIGSMLLSALIDPERTAQVAATPGAGAEDLPQWFTLDNTSVSLLELRPGGQTVVGWINRIDHLATMTDHEPSRTTNPFPPAAVAANDGGH